MKLTTLILISIYLVVGCSSNDDDTPPLDDPRDPFFTESNLPTVLPEIFTVLRAEPFEEFIKDTDGLPVPLETNPSEDLIGFQETNIRTDDAGSRTFVDYVCDNGGTVAFSVLKQASGAEFYSDHTADRCVVGNYTYIGQRLSSTRSSGRNYEFPDGFVIDSTGTDTRRMLQGEREAQNSAALPIGSLTWSILSFTSNSNNNPSNAVFQSILKFDDEASDASESRNFSVSFSLDAVWSGGKTLTAKTLEEFGSFGDQNTYGKGAIEVTAEDGSKILIDAANGDPDTYQVTIQSEGGSSSVTLNWGGYAKLPCLSAFAVSEGIIDAKGCSNVLYEPAPITIIAR